MALQERLQNTTQVGYWTGEIPLEYVYTAGRAGEAFFRNLKEKGTFLAARCEKCDITYVPPRIYCEKCFARLEDSYVDVGADGVVHTFTVVFKNLDGSEKEKPAILAMINIEGTDGGLVHYVGDIEPDDVYIGLPVVPVLKPENERQGGITDILYFTPDR